jgi:quinol monooxygenase YgiN
MAEDVTVVARMKVEPGEEQRALEILRAVIQASHGEDGCVKYTLHRSSNEPGAFCIVEKWRSQADLDAHFKRPHMAPLAEAIELLSEPPRILFCEPVAVGDPVKGS